MVENYSQQFNDAINGVAETEEATFARRKLMVAYRNSFNQDNRQTLKDQLRQLGFLSMIDPENPAASVLHNEAILILFKLGILSDRRSFDRIVDALMDLPVIEPVTTHPNGGSAG